ncbi:hypothetical protein CTAYLR_007032 [Chrysophaeum taylorii]|uniref:RGS domain-containing protein n=1 Tax=Chrysophaeum taylorii TaxID=2483200 RepID=A0AAD7U775_9STRA|nr:hypothetical protein CTAYLR_007032 [Chrysophaeum taylorii]
MGGGWSKSKPEPRVYSTLITKLRSSIASHASIIEMCVAEGEVVAKESIRVLYPGVDTQVFDQAFRMFDWTATGAEAIANVKMFGILMVSLFEQDPRANFFDCAFTIFDADESEDLDKDEFASMIYAMMTSRASALKLLMSSTSGRKSLLNFASREHSGENLDFLLDVDNWDSSDTQTGALIMARFIGDTAETPVNLSAKCAKECLATFQAAGGNDAVDLPPTLFLKAKNEILKTIERDTFARFNKDKEEVDILVANLFAEVDTGRTGKIDKAEYIAWANENPQVIDFYNRLTAVVEKRPLRRNHP